MKNKFSTPVLLLIFNRPDTTKIVFEQIKKIKPSRLFIASDGARKNKIGEKTIVEKTRKLVMNNIKWNCEVKTLFRDSNLGCKTAVSSAIDWFFCNVKKGIIIEDDCVPSQSFFKYCEELLYKYEKDLRVWHISGNNFNSPWVRDNDYSYYFSYYGSIWGWATWSDRWQHYNVDMEGYEELKKKKYFEDIFGNKKEAVFRIKSFDKILNGLDTWDYQWVYTRLVNRGLSVIPKINLVKNLGFGGKATHTLQRNDPRRQLEIHDIKFPLKHPRFIIRDKKSDDRYFKEYICNASLIKKLIKKIIKK